MLGVQVTELQSRAAYREPRSHLFGSDPSLGWYLRQNKVALVECGALVLHGNRWLINASKMDAYVVAAGSAAAKRQCLQRGAGAAFGAGRSTMGGMQPA